MYHLLLLESHPEIRNDELRGLVELAVRTRIHAAQHQQRTAAKRCCRGLDAIAAAGRAAGRSLLKDWVLDGTPIGDFRGVDLLPFAETAIHQADGLTRNARFFRWLAKEAGTDLVRDRVTGERAARKWTEIELTGGAEAV